MGFKGVVGDTGEPGGSGAKGVKGQRGGTQVITGTSPPSSSKYNYNNYMFIKLLLQNKNKIFSDSFSL
jgi:hypothetical protein